MMTGQLWISTFKQCLGSQYVQKLVTKNLTIYKLHDCKLLLFLSNENSTSLFIQCTLCYRTKDMSQHMTFMTATKSQLHPNIQKTSVCVYFSCTNNFNHKTSLFINDYKVTSQLFLVNIHLQLNRQSDCLCLLVSYFMND